jgi:hypothetical protein
MESAPCDSRDSLILREMLSEFQGIYGISVYLRTTIWKANMLVPFRTLERQHNLSLPSSDVHPIDLRSLYHP